MKIYYFGNAITNVTNENLLKTFKLREDGKTTNLLADCCKTVMLTDHPQYQGNVASVLASAATVHCNEMKSQARLNLNNDWSKHPDTGELPEYTGEGITVNAEADFAKVDPSVMGKMMAAFGTPPTKG